MSEMVNYVCGADKPLVLMEIQSCICQDTLFTHADLQRMVHDGTTRRRRKKEEEVKLFMTNLRVMDARQVQT